MNILLTGGCGFIGSAVIRAIIRARDHRVVNLDKLTYAASEDALEEARSHERHTLIRADIADASAVRAAFARYQPDVVMHLAAESHVDRSIDGPGAFIRTNIVGTYTLLEEARAYWSTCRRRGARRSASIMFRPTKCSARSAPTIRRSPKPPPTTRAALIPPPRRPPTIWRARGAHTYGLPVIVSNTVNNYGPWQFPEKLIPLVALNALEGKPLPVYGDGSNRRDWLFVDDHAAALLKVLERGEPGATYAIGARQPRSNLQVVQAICAHLDRRLPDPAGPRTRLIRFVTDRPGHDFRYEIDPSRSERALDWAAEHDFERGLARTLDWYLGNRAWWQAVRAARYEGQRLGTAREGRRVKGILLAGGSGTRLHPMTVAASKQLLPIYDKPMVYYPLSTLMLAGIRDLLVISTPEDLPQFSRLLGDGERFGVRISYAEQPRPEGLAQAFLIGRDWVAANPAPGARRQPDPRRPPFRAAANGRRSAHGATVFAYQVRDPERYGVVSFDAAGAASRSWRSRRHRTRTGRSPGSISTTIA